MRRAAWAVSRSDGMPLRGPVDGWCVRVRMGEEMAPMEASQGKAVRRLVLCHLEAGEVGCKTRGGRTTDTFIHRV